MARPRPPLRLDLGALRDVAADVLDVAADVAALGTRWRLPLPLPATDPATVDLHARRHHGRLTLGMAAGEAADEAGRMIEWVLGAAYGMAALATHTQLAIRGLAVPTPAVTVTVAPRALRSALIRPPARDQATDPGPDTGPDNDVLDLAVLVAAGAPDVTPSDPRADVDALRGARDRLTASAHRLRDAASDGERPAAALTRLGDWLADDLGGAMTAHAAQIVRWDEAYRALRAAAAGPAEYHGRALAAGLLGAEPPPDRPPLDALRRSWSAYLRVVVAGPVLPPTPALGARPASPTDPPADP